ncbi:hypothetical protein [Streptomyces spiramyceticus]|uniref:hypothetical protein n=1 Tax=Streptomyces spiramyceticus TaxID=299717 RepID=UPI003B75CD8A
MLTHFGWTEDATHPSAPGRESINLNQGLFYLSWLMDHGASSGTWSAPRAARRRRAAEVPRARRAEGAMAELAAAG